MIGLVDTNADPDEAEYVIPGNDDAIRSCDLVARVVADGIAAGRSKVTIAELSTPAEPAAEPAAEDASEEPAVEPELETAAVAEGGDSE